MTSNQTLTSRINSLDLLRGIVMVLMVLDHTRFFYGLKENPENLETTSVALFLTRWVTHFCAPVFIFLTGISGSLYEQKKGSKKELSRFLLTRGLFLIVLELTVFKFAWEFGFSVGNFSLLVIWAIGITMIFLAGMIFLNRSILFVIGIVILVGHNMLDGVSFPEGTTADALWKLLHVSGWFPLGESSGVFVLYPVLPYFGLVLLGYCLGEWYSTEVDRVKRKSLLLWSGVACCLLFVVLRYSNAYGDPKPWSVQKDGVFTLLSFIATTKYPTSLLYLLMTIGPSLMFLSVTENAKSRVSNILITIGRTPMYFYLWHLFIIHFSALAMGMNSHGLIVVYVATLLINAVLYFLCERYGRYKFSHPEKKWLGYL